MTGKDSGRSAPLQGKDCFISGSNSVGSVFILTDVISLSSLTPRFVITTIYCIFRHAVEDSFAYCYLVLP